MELLTGKALADFNMWLLKQGNETIVNGSIEYDLYYMCKYMIPESMVCAKVIEWLDIVGIYVFIEPSIPIGWEKPDCFIFRVNSETNRNKFKDRSEATKQAIIHANKIYNDGI